MTVCSTASAISPLSVTLSEVLYVAEAEPEVYAEVGQASVVPGSTTAATVGLAGSSGATSAPSDPYEWVKSKWLEAELGNKVKIGKFEKQVVKAALEKKKFDPSLMDLVTAFLKTFSPGAPVPKSLSKRIDMLLEVAFKL